MASNSLSSSRVVTTSHSANGTSIIGSDTQIKPFFPFGPASSSFSIMHSSDAVPVSNTGPLPSSKTSSIPRAPPSGVILCTTDFQPGGGSPMHRTVSLDYGCVIFGEITMKLDGGAETVIRAGDFIVQRGAMHLWYNHTKDPCRILCVMLGSEKIVTEEGKELDAFFPTRPGA